MRNQDLQEFIEAQGVDVETGEQIQLEAEEVDPTNEDTVMDERVDRGPAAGFHKAEEESGRRASANRRSGDPPRQKVLDGLPLHVSLPCEK